MATASRKSLLGSTALAAMAALAFAQFATAETEVNQPLAALPPMPIPADNPMTKEKIKLGELLFFDARLSGNGSISCADCHDPRLGWGAAPTCRAATWAPCTGATRKPWSTRPI